MSEPDRILQGEYSYIEGEQSDGGSCSYVDRGAELLQSLEQLLDVR